MLRSCRFACSLFVCTTMSMLAQNFTPVCSGGIRADGYIDFSGLPPAPKSVAGVLPKPITRTLSVQGIPGLTVQVTISLERQQFYGVPLYTTNSGILDFPSNPSGTLQFEFSEPVYGMSIEGNVDGRSGGFSLATNEDTGRGIYSQLGPDYSTGVEGVTLGYSRFSSNLQAVGNLSEAFVSFPAGGYGSPEVMNVRIQSKPSPDSAMISEDGLQQWLKSESATDPLAGTASIWPDQSGKGHDATQASYNNEPFQVGTGGQTCRGGFVFSNKHYFDFDLPIDGWDEMTVFLVSRVLGDPPAGTTVSEAAALLWNAKSPSGNTFISPRQGLVALAFGTQQPNNQLVYGRPATVGEDFTISRTVHNKSVDSLYIDGLHVLTQENRKPVLSGATGAAYIGRGANGTYFNGEVNEVLIYNRVLSDNETRAVEAYLRNKFGTQ